MYHVDEGIIFANCAYKIITISLLHMKAKFEAYLKKKKSLCSKHCGYCYRGSKRKNQIKSNAQ